MHTPTWRIFGYYFPSKMAVVHTISVWRRNRSRPQIKSSLRSHLVTASKCPPTFFLLILSNSYVLVRMRPFLYKNSIQLYNFHSTLPNRNGHLPSAISFLILLNFHTLLTTTLQRSFRFYCSFPYSIFTTTNIHV
jgi:hypothetical protein